MQVVNHVSALHAEPLQRVPVENDISRERYSLDLRPDWRRRRNDEPYLVVEILKNQSLWQAEQLRRH